ncbi:MAG: YjbQ family protein [Planctomycetes bacterium]|nr:YjbQ family protein [Planctomycetota bacterium]
MIVTTQDLTVATQHRDQMVDITRDVTAILEASQVREGTVTVFVPHTTAGVTINENADPDVVHDLLLALDQVAPWHQGFYRHGEGNSAAHVKSSLVGCSQSVLVRAGRLILGQWQSLWLCEFDGPRSRRVIVRVTGE